MANETFKPAPHIQAMIDAGKLPESLQTAPEDASDMGDSDASDDGGAGVSDLDFLTQPADKKPADADTKTKRKVTFKDFLGDDVEEEIDIDAELPVLAASRKRVKDLEDEMKALRDELEGRSKAISAKEEKVKKYLELEGKDPQDIIDALLAKKGGFDALRKQIIEEHAEYSKLTPEEQRAFDAKRTEAESLRRLKEMEARLAEKEKRLKTEELDVSRKNEIERLKTIFGQYRVANPDNDKATDAINRLIFEDAQAGLAALQKSGVTITESILHREFKRAAQTFRGKITTGVKTDPKKEIQEQLDANAAKVKTIETGKTNLAAFTASDQEQMKAWVTDLKAGKIAKVQADASDKGKMSLYNKLLSLIQANPQIIRGK